MSIRSALKAETELSDTAARSLTAIGKRDKSFDETNTPRQRREGRGGDATEVHPEIWKCSGSKALLPLIGYLIQALAVATPSSSPSQHPSSQLVTQSFSILPRLTVVSTPC